MLDPTCYVLLIKRAALVRAALSNLNIEGFYHIDACGGHQETAS